jgi:hypothetical protein
LVKLLIAIKPVCCGQVSLLHLHEDNHNINKLALFHVKVDIGPQKLFGKQRNIKLIGIEAGKIASFKLIGKGLGNHAGMAGHLLHHHQKYHE